MYLRHTSSSNLCHSEDHVSLMWALAFYIIEHHHQHVDQVPPNTNCLDSRFYNNFVKIVSSWKIYDKLTHENLLTLRNHFPYVLQISSQLYY